MARARTTLDPDDLDDFDFVVRSRAAIQGCGKQMPIPMASLLIVWMPFGLYHVQFLSNVYYYRNSVFSGKAAHLFFYSLPVV